MIALTNGFFLKPETTFGHYLANVVVLFGGFVSIFVVSEIVTEVIAVHYSVKLSSSFLFHQSVLVV